MNIEQSVINKAARQMAKAIDDELLMTTMGWHKLELSEGTVYGAKYLTVHPNNGWHWNEMMEWMIATFGPSGTPENPGCWTPDQRWYANNAKFWFRNEKDRTMFILRWS
jgi:hypothetical protein